LETDILGGKNAGMRTALVLTGVSTQDSLLASEIQPDFVLKTLEQLTSVLEGIES
jgi:ribonucleotide monophosphatase NagD (HAD superfamily)